jgi:hypothetical protein
VWYIFLVRIMPLDGHKIVRAESEIWGRRRDIKSDPMLREKCGSEMCGDNLDFIKLLGNHWT